MKISFQFLVSLAFLERFSAQECSGTWKCRYTSTPPILDADHNEWEEAEDYTTDLIMTSGSPYDAGKANYRCMYDDENIYFSLEIPGHYRFSTEDNHLCAAIGTMFKIGAKASFINMGGCPDAMGGCESVPDTCDEYRVDIGAHWELKTTQQGVAYGVANSGNATASQSRQAGTGNDLIANNDDEYAVSPYCRFDDDGENAGNEWSGAWAHTNPVEGEFGTYKFEMARTLKTPSPMTDAQLTPGETYQFGVAFWDPFELEDMGWTDIGHYLTGCASRWINLELVKPGQEEEIKVEDTDSAILRSFSAILAASTAAVTLLMSF